MAAAAPRPVGAGPLAAATREATAHSGAAPSRPARPDGQAAARRPACLPLAGRAQGRAARIADQAARAAVAQRWR